MRPQCTLALAGVTHRTLKAHLFPGDGQEAAAILICTPSPGPRDRLVVSETIMVPRDECKRSSDAITWPAIYIENAIDIAEPEGLTIVLLHSHPGGWLDFSSIDDISDQRILPGLFEDFGTRHGSAVMTPDGAIRARLYNRDLTSTSVDLVTVAGDDIAYWWSDQVVQGHLPPAYLAFTSGMREELSRLSAAVVGVSGTGSIMSEQLARLGFGKIVLVDYDSIEHKNLNRILNSSTQDADMGRSKVEMFAEAIASHRGPGIAVPVSATINSRSAVLAVGQCDVVFSCVDSQEARQILDLISAAFVMPLFDVGVTIPTNEFSNGNTEIVDVCGRIDYVQPGGSSLADRGVYTQEGIRAEFLRGNDPQAYEDEVADGYIKGLIEEAPSVITLNMRAASAMANEFIVRTYRLRHASNCGFARTFFSIAACEEDYDSEDAFTVSESMPFGRGATEPLLGLPSLRQSGQGAA